MVDYPAAHSMDTTWFGVDEDGFVALFDSGEAGAVPRVRDSGLDADGVVDGILERAPRQPIRLDPSSLGWSPESGHDLDRPNIVYYGQRSILFLKDLAPVEALLREGRACEVPTTRGFAVIVVGLTARLVQSIHAKKLCLGCGWFYGMNNDGAEAGFYRYDHTTDNGISGPYGRDAVPERPLRVDDLPEAIRARVGQVRFKGVRFAETTHIQPAGTMPCSSWQGQYMTLEGEHMIFDDD